MEPYLNYVEEESRYYLDLLNFQESMLSDKFDLS